MNKGFSELSVVIPDKNAFYSLYSDGILSSKIYSREQKETLITYEPNAVIFLYYTYPTHREACVIRNIPEGGALLPGCTRKARLLFSVQASLVDKLKRAAGFINANTSPNAFSRSDGFYIRLYYLLCQRGKLNYFALRKLAEDMR